jgi:hypothetical protein
MALNSVLASDDLKNVDKETSNMMEIDTQVYFIIILNKLKIDHCDE